MAKAGALGRTAALTVRPRPRTIHTFHGHVLEGYFTPAVQRGFILAERALARTTDVLVAVSTETRDELLDLRIGRPSQYRVIPLGLELDAHYLVDEGRGTLRGRFGLGTSVPLVGIVGRLVPIKDVRSAIAAVAMLPGVHLAVVGDGELRAELEQQVMDAALIDRVHFTGWCQDIPAVMSDLDVVLLTSRNEGTPVALIEASACARPVVATDVGGVASVVLDGYTGYLRRAGDVAGLADSLATLLEDRELRRRMGEAGRAHVVSRFGGERLVADMAELYDELLA
jgi:glycosyltransferase involved in cell wall biosynthesis